MSFQFPNIKDKLDAPAKKSAFEKAKAEAEAKRQREAAETAAVYEDFVKSFEDESPRYRRSTEDRGYGGYSRGPPSRPPAGPSGRHSAPRPDGPRSDNPPHPSSSSRRYEEGSPPGPGSGFSSRKREFDTYKRDSDGPRGGHGGPSRGRGGRGSGVLGFEDASEYMLPKPPSGSARKFTKFAEDDDEEDRDNKSRDQPKPTIHLTHLPPKIAKPFILDLMKPYFPTLTPNQITLQLPSNIPRGPSEPSSSSSSSLSSQTQSQARKASSALIMLQSDTASSEIDAAVNGLANKYLGQGYRLGISRHLPSTALHSAVTPIASQGSAPFGARQLFQGGGGRGGRGYAPPPSYSGPGSGVNSNRMRVTVAIPKDLRVLKVINKMIEAVLTHGPEFEALLMATPSVISDERFAWLWDCRAPEHVYYRWKLWDVVTSDGSNKSRGRSRSYAGTTVTQLFESGATWELPPKRVQKFEFITRLEDFIDDGEYHSSSEEDEDHHQAQDSNPSAEETKTYLGPLRRAKLMHLLSRIPPTTGTLRRGDVARVTAFAVENAYAAEEVVDILCSNVVRPVALSKANPDYEPSNNAAQENDNGDDKDNNESNEKQTKQDTTSLRLIGLYLISDVLSNSGLGVRNVWRYRQIFDQRLREGKVFESLAEVALKENWGKIRQEKWRRSIQVVMSLWENWNIFPQKSHEEMKQAFAEPTAALQAASSQAEVKAEATKGSVAASRWKSVMAASAAQESIEEKKFNPYLDSSAENKLPVEDESEMVDVHIDGEAMDEDQDVDGVAMDEDDEDVDGVPMTDSDEGMSDVDGNESVPADEVQEEETKEKEAPQEKRPAIGFKFQMAGSATKNVSTSNGEGKDNQNAPADSKDKDTGNQGRGKRMRAEDMFAADEDDDDVA